MSSNIRPSRPRQVPVKPPLTPRQRDRQARGKDPYVSSSDGEDGDDTRLRLGSASMVESFEEQERRGWAMAVLDDPEQLLMYALSTDDSVPGQRLRAVKALCGFDALYEEEEQPEQRAPATRKDATRKKTTGEGSGR